MCWLAEVEDATFATKVCSSMRGDSLDAADTRGAILCAQVLYVAIGARIRLVLKELAAAGLAGYEVLKPAVVTPALLLSPAHLSPLVHEDSHTALGMINPSGLRRLSIRNLVE